MTIEEIIQLELDLKQFLVSYRGTEPEDESARQDIETRLNHYIENQITAQVNKAVKLAVEECEREFKQVAAQIMENSFQSMKSFHPQLPF